MGARNADRPEIAEMMPSPSANPLVPSWLSRLAAIGWRVLVAVALGLVLLGLAITLSTTVLSLLVGFIAAATLAPLAARLRARGWSGLKAAGGVTGALVLGLLALLVVTFVAFAPFVVQLTGQLTSAIDAIKAQLATYPFGDEVLKVLQVLFDAARSRIQSEVAALASTIGTIGTIAMLGLFMTFFILADGDKAWAKSLQPMDPWRRERLTRAGRDAIDRAGGYLRETIALALVRAVVVWPVMLVLGVPLAGPLAILLFFAGLVPYVGAFMATVAIILIADLGGGALVALVMLAVIVAVTVFAHRVVSPRLPGTAAGLHPAVVLIGIAIGGALAGVLGMIIAVPTIGFLGALIRPMLEVLGDRDEGPDDEDEAVPLWLDRIAQWSWRLLVGIGLGLVFVAAAARVPLVVGPVVVGITIAATFLPALRSLTARGLTRLQASLLISVALWTAIVLVVVLSVAALAGQASLGDTASGIDDSGPTPGAILKAIITVYSRGLLSIIAEGIARIVGLFVFIALTALLSFYFLTDGSRAWAAITSRLSTWRRREIETAGTRGATILGDYMIATGILGGFNAITGFVIMVLLGLPLAFPIALLSFLGGFIPYIGQALTSLLAFLVAFKFGTTQDIVIMGLYTIVMNVVQGSFIAPLLYGRAVSIHPAIVLLAIPAGGELAGVLGMFLAVPVIGVFAAVWRNVLAALGEAPTTRSAPEDATVQPGPAPAGEAASAPSGP